LEFATIETGKADILSGVAAIPWFRGRTVLSLCLLALATAATLATAQQVAQPVRIIVPFAPGSTSDVVARLIAADIHDATGRVVIVDNKPGADGRIAIAALKQSLPDGGTLLMTPIALPVILPLTVRQLDFRSGKDYAPVTQVAEFEFALAVGVNHPAKNLPEFIAWARANPNAASFGAPGGGGLPQLFGAMIAKTTGIELIYVAYKSAAPLAGALMGDQIASAMGALSDFIALHRAGKIRIIATTGTQRSAFAPEIATFREQGLANIVGTSWIAVLAPAQTPKEAIDRWSTVIVAALHKPELRDKLVRLGVEPTGTTPEALGTIIAADTARWEPIVKATGFTLE